MRARTVFPLFVVLAMFGGMANADVLINELDCDQVGTDAGEFVELYGPPSTALDGLVVVFFNGSSDLSYAAYDLDGYSTDASGYFLLGNALVVPVPSIIFADNFLQNGADAVALYTGNATDFPANTPVTTTNLIDAIVYDTADADDPGLLVLLLAGEPQIDESANSTPTTDAVARCVDGAGGARVTSQCVTIPPTPGAANNGTCPAPEQACCFEDGSCQLLLEADCVAAGGTVYPDLICDPNPCPAPPVEMDLCTAIQDDVNGDPLYYLTVVHITSPLLVLNDADEYTLGSVDCGATDGTCCVNLFDFNNTTVLMAGDMVDVIGTVNRYNGKAELTNLTLTVLSSGNPLPPPEEITTEELMTNGELYESCLISICGLMLTDPSLWPATGANANLDVYDATGVHATLRVDKETDIDGSAVPVQPFTCVGLGCQFDNASPYFEGYQILPRMRLDILDGVDCPPVPQACCFASGACELRLADDCLAAGGTVYPDLTCDPNPCPQPQACCFGPECQLLLADACLAAGGTVYPELICDPNPCPQPPEYACCFADGSCQVLTEEACTAAGGVLYTVDSCDPNPCPPPEYACCFNLDEACYMMSQAACIEAGGIWNDGQVCTASGGTFDCPLWRVCCVNEECSITTEIGCGQMGGVWHVDWTSCEPDNPCEIPVPVSPDSWGAIKSIYR